ARERGQRGYEAYALRFLGEVAARRGRPEQAKAYYCDALDLAQALGMRPLVAHCHLGRGRFCTGRAAEAREPTIIAARLYRDMDMPFWLEQAEAEPIESA